MLTAIKKNGLAKVRATLAMGKTINIYEAIRLPAYLAMRPSVVDSLVRSQN